MKSGEDLEVAAKEYILKYAPDLLLGSPELERFMIMAIKNAYFTGNRDGLLKGREIHRDAYAQVWGGNK